MATKKFKPRTPGRRGQVLLDRSEITTSEPEKSLIAVLEKSVGRNNQGRITTRHKSSGNKKKYRIIDFKRDKFGIPGTVKTIEYDPNRTAYIALITYEDKEKNYIISPQGLKVGAKVESGPDAEIKAGNALPLRDIPVGEVVHNIEFNLGKGGQYVRSAGTGAQLLAKEGSHATIRMPSGEMRKFHIDAMATLGTLSNKDWKNLNWGKAGKSRHRGIKPTVRGSVMNPCDHPHGGGEGKAPIGGIPKDPWGNRQGRKTRKKKKASNKYIVTTRKGKGLAK